MDPTNANSTGNAVDSMIGINNANLHDPANVLDAELPEDIPFVLDGEVIEVTDDKPFITAHKKTVRITNCVFNVTLCGLKEYSLFVMSKVKGYFAGNVINIKSTKTHKVTIFEALDSSIVIYNTLVRAESHKKPVDIILTKNKNSMLSVMGTVFEGLGRCGGTFDLGYARASKIGRRDYTCADTRPCKCAKTYINGLNVFSCSTCWRYASNIPETQYPNTYPSGDLTVTVLNLKDAILQCQPSSCKPHVDDDCIIPVTMEAYIIDIRPVESV